MSDKCIIEFKVKDFFPNDMRYLLKNIWNITNIVQKNPELITVVKEFLFSFIDNNDFSKKFAEWVSKQEKTKELYEEKSYENLIEELGKSYKGIKDYHVDKFRGIIFEKIMENHYEDKYGAKSDKLSYGCQVIINKQEVKYIDLEDYRNNRVSVDIARFSEKSSEFNELKVGPESFKLCNIRYLNILTNAAKNEKISDEIEVGCMTLKSKGKLNLKLRKLKEDISYLKLIGFEQVREMLCD